MGQFFINNRKRGKLKHRFIRQEKPLVKEQRMKMIKVKFLGIRGGGGKSGEGHTAGEAYEFQQSPLKKPYSILTQRRLKY